MSGGWRGQRRLLERKPLMTKRDVVKARLEGLEVRQNARVERRKAQRVRKPVTVVQAVQPSLWSDDDLDAMALRDRTVAQGRPLPTARFNANPS